MVTDRCNISETRLKGIPVSPGIAISSLNVRAKGMSNPESFTINSQDIPSEWSRLEKALKQTEEQLAKLQDKIKQVTGEKEAAIFDAHILFLHDQSLLKNIRLELARRLQNIESILFSVVQNYLEALRRVDDPYLRSKTSDVEDVLHRILNNLKGTEPQELDIPSETFILVAYDLTPSDTAAMDPTKILGFATEAGSSNSHTAILARSMGLPAIVGVPRVMLDAASQQPAILDGYKGILILNPTEETVASYKIKQAAKEKAYQALESLKNLPAQTLDGRRIRLAVNVEFSHEYENIKTVGAEGVGLYRTEFFLLGERILPSEEIQTERYTELVQNCAPHQVIFRTLDSGGDKLPCEILDEPESNPFLGWRGIRVSLSRPAIFKEQLKAILRASAYGPCGVMFPMISGRTEVIRAKNLLDECRAELDEKNIPYGKDLKVGIMIEVPSAATIADILAKEVDFFSIGTNDLTQYTIAVDRVNFRVANMFRPTHPGVIRLIDMALKAGSKEGIHTAICGEMAGDITLLPLLIGFGTNELSVGVHNIPIIRYAIRHLNYEECRLMAERALEGPDSATILDLTLQLAQKSYPALFQ